MFFHPGPGERVRLRQRTARRERAQRKARRGRPRLRASGSEPGRAAEEAAPRTWSGARGPTAKHAGRRPAGPEDGLVVGHARISEAGGPRRSDPNKTQPMSYTESSASSMARRPPTAAASV